MYPQAATTAECCETSTTGDEPLTNTSANGPERELDRRATDVFADDSLCGGTTPATHHGPLVDVRNQVPGSPQGVALVGRQKELEQGLQALRAQRYVEIQGPAGEGKSTLARHLVAQVCQAWEQLTAEEAGGPLIYALEVDLRELVGCKELKDALADKIFALVNEPASDANWHMLLAFLRRQAAHVLVLMENAEAGLLSEAHSQDLTAALNALHAMPNVHLVLATRVPGPAITGVSGAVVRLRQLAEEEGLGLVKAHLPPDHVWGTNGKDRDTARQLVRLVEGNPLALSVAAGLDCSKAKSSWQDVVKSTQDGLAVGLPRWDLEPGSNKYTALLSSWLASFLTQDDQRLLTAAAMFGGSFTAAGAAAVVGWSDEAVNHGLQRLVSASLLAHYTVHVSSSRQAAGWQCYRQEQRYSMHAVIKQAALALAAAVGLQTEMEPAATGGCLSWLRRVVSRRAVPRASCHAVPIPIPAQAYAHWMVQHQEGPGQTLLRCVPDGVAPDMKRRLALVGQELLNFSALADVIGTTLPVAEGCMEGLLDQARYVGWQLSSNGYGLVAKRLLETVHAVADEQLGREHQVALSCKADLACALQEMGELQEARRLGEEVLEVQTRVLGPDHPDTVLNKANLANTVHCMGELTQARQLNKEVLEVSTRVLGPEHPETLKNMGNLAHSMHCMGELREARRLEEEVLEVRARVMGLEHPHTLIAQINLAISLADIGQLKEARQLQEEVLEVLMRVLGAEHRRTLVNKGKLGTTVREMGQLREARQLQEAVLEGLTQKLGPEHQYTLSSKSELGTVLLDMGELREARRLQEEVLEAQARVLGPFHPDALKSKGHLADALQHMGDLQGARRLLEEVLGVQTRVLGPGHPDTLTSKACLGVTLRDMGELREARRLLEEVVEARRQVLGAEHPRTLASKGAVAALLQGMGELREAQRLLEEVLAVQTQVLGLQHPATLTSKGRLGVTLRDMGELREATQVLQEVVEAQTRVLGAEHPSTLASKNWLAGSLTAAQPQP